MTVIPHTTQTASTTTVGAPNRSPAATALEPDSAMATIVSVVRPRRSARAPAATQPMAPAATIRKATPLAPSASTLPETARLAAMKAGTQVHIA